LRVVDVAIYITIEKVDETDTDVTYAFGPELPDVGKVRLIKATGAIEVITVVESRRDFYLSRVGRVLARHHAAGDYPGKTCYAA
jgi:hypothetical protein